MDNNKFTKIDAILDLTGVECPDFGLSLRSYFRQTKAETLVVVRANVHNAERDVNRLCAFSSHTLLATRKVTSGSNPIIEFAIKAG